MALSQIPTGPVVSPRGIVNAFTQQAAPSQVAPGALIWIHGLNLGPDDGRFASGFPLPTRLGDPAVEVLINGVAVPLISVRPTRIVAQVPWQARQGLASVVVRRGEARSREARVMISQPWPSLRTRDDKGYGEVSGGLADRILTVPATGLGVTDPAPVTGQPGPKDPEAALRGALRAYVGGIQAPVTAALSPERAGEFEVKITMPPQSRPGDMITVIAGNRPANRLTYSAIASPEMRFMRLPEGTPLLRALVASDLRPDYLVMSAERDGDGCYPSFLFNLARNQARKIDECLISSNRNAPTPIVSPDDTGVLAALIGPPEGDATAGISSKVLVLNPARDEPMVAELAAKAAGLASGPNGNLNAVVPGDPPQVITINVQNGRPSEPQNVVPQGAATGVGQVAVRFPEVDLGDGFKHMLAAPQQLLPGVFVSVVGDDASAPKRAKVAVFALTGEVAGTQDFPEGWLPLLAALPPQQPGRTDPIPGAGTPAQQAPVFRVTTRFDGETATYFVLAQRSQGENNAVIAFTLEGPGPQVIPFPDSWFAAACAGPVRMFNLELVHSVALFGSKTPVNEFKNPCPANGFLLLNMEKRSLLPIPVPGHAQINTSAAIGDVNDFLFATNTDPARRGVSDVLIVLDGASGLVARFDMPIGVVGYFGITPVAGMNALVGLAMNRAAGDEGLLFFDLEEDTVRLLPTPEGFASVNTVAVFPITRKLVARGVKPNNGGTQYLVYDLLTGDVHMPPNPPGVVWVGTAPRPPAQPGQPAPPAVPMLEDISPRANMIAAMGYDAERRQIGVFTLRIP